MDARPKPAGSASKGISRKLAALLCLPALAMFSACAPSGADVRPKFDVDGTSVEQANSFYAMGKSNFAKAEIGLAVKNFGLALARDPLSTEVLNGLAASYDRLGRFDLARQYYQRALRVEPDSVQTINNIGYSYYLQGEFELATSFLAKIGGSVGTGSVVGRNFLLARSAAVKARRDRCRWTAKNRSIEPVAPRSDTIERARTPRIVRINALVRRLVMEEEAPNRPETADLLNLEALLTPISSVENDHVGARTGRAAMGDGMCPPVHAGRAGHSGTATAVDFPENAVFKFDAVDPAVFSAHPIGDRYRSADIEVQIDIMPDLFEFKPTLINPTWSGYQNDSV